MSEEELGRAIRSELQRRITELATYPEQTFGPLRTLDWAVTLVLFITLPLLLVWVLR